MIFNMATPLGPYRKGRSLDGGGDRLTFRLSCGLSSQLQTADHGRERVGVSSPEHAVWLVELLSLPNQDSLSLYSPFPTLEISNLDSVSWDPES